MGAGRYGGKGSGEILRLEFRGDGLGWGYLLTGIWLNCAVDTCIVREDVRMVSIKGE